MKLSSFFGDSRHKKAQNQRPPMDSTRPTAIPRRFRRPDHRCRGHQLIQASLDARARAQLGSDRFRQDDRYWVWSRVKEGFYGEKELDV